jgi:hypothetical protein
MEGFKEEIIYPTNIKKYVGSVKVESSGKCRFLMNRYEIRVCKTFNTKQEAIDEKKLFNIQNDLPIKNVIHRFTSIEDPNVGYLSVGISGNKTKDRLLVDLDCMDIIDSHLWIIRCLKGVNYCVTSVEFRKLENIILDTRYPVQHKNGNTMDNRRENLVIIAPTQDESKNIIRKFYLLGDNIECHKGGEICVFSIDELGYKEAVLKAADWLRS